MSRLLAFKRSDNSTQFHFQSHDIGFSDFINLLTLCLAPLIAHVVAGVPSPVYLTDKPLPILKRIGHYNPTSILWRYFAIMDRRVRSHHWNPAEMAACNADFWTETGWDGSEEMMVRSRGFCTRLPVSSHIDGVSSSAVSTVIVTIQGIQALYNLLHAETYGYSINLGTLFQPLAIFGLVRLLAAFWISDDFSYANVEANSHRTLPYSSNANTVRAQWQPSRKKEAENNVVSGRSPSREVTLDSMDVTAMQASNMATQNYAATYSREPLLYSANSWRGITTRALYLLIVLALDGITIYYAIDGATTADFTVTSLAQDIFFLVLLSVTAMVFLWHFARNNSRSTVIPCVSDPWYVAYTIFIFLIAVTMVVVAALETQRTGCGEYTTYSLDVAGPLLCNPSAQDLRGRTSSHPAPSSWW